MELTLDELLQSFKADEPIEAQELATTREFKCPHDSCTHCENHEMCPQGDVTGGF